MQIKFVGLFNNIIVIQRAKTILDPCKTNFNKEIPTKQVRTVELKLTQPVALWLPFNCRHVQPMCCICCLFACTNKHVCCAYR